MTNVLCVKKSFVSFVSDDSSIQSQRKKNRKQKTWGNFELWHQVIQNYSQHWRSGTQNMTNWFPFFTLLQVATNQDNKILQTGSCTNVEPKTQHEKRKKNEANENTSILRIHNEEGPKLTNYFRHNEISHLSQNTILLRFALFNSMQLPNKYIPLYNEMVQMHLV